ncbi:MAG: adenylate/guanylate cyclase domain-containing protein [Myxococcales bacterium]|nr:adenylate/guanylate cyclase domain-containing protein [Myxococcales bacterium]
MAKLGQVGTGASADRLEELMEQRLRRGADKAAIDRRIWDLFGEEWAVMFTDLSGFSRQVAEFGIIHFLQVIYESQRVLIPVIADHDGIVLKTEGDSLLVIFRRPERALRCAIAMQRALKRYNRRKSPSEKILLCVGIGFGPMLRIGDDDVFGPEVNAASKLGEDLARAFEILVTDSVKKTTPGIPGVSFQKTDLTVPGAKAAWRVKYRL